MEFNEQHYTWIYRLSLIGIALVLFGVVITPWILVFVKDGVKNLIEGIPLATIAGITLYLLVVTSPVNLIFSAAAYWSSGRLASLENTDAISRQMIFKRLMWITGVISTLLLVAVLLVLILVMTLGIDLGGIR
jgi:hypothetical protein